MTSPNLAPQDTKLDLVLEREIAAPPEKVWRALTEPELIKQWFCPKPWQTVECRIDLRPGGEFYTVMESPEGESFPGSSCILEATPQQRLIWTAALAPGYRPAAPAAKDDKECNAIIFTCIMTLAATTTGTSYKALVLHNTPAQMKAHEDMGFHAGWNAACDQMVDVIKAL